MREFVLVTGIVLKTSNLGEFDKRMVLLTKERGKITVFARGARRQNSRFMAVCNPFSFGEFKLFEGRSAYNLMEASISNYFENLRNDLEAACYGQYFLEVADYYGRENNDEVMLLKLLYQSLRALSNEKLDNCLIRYIFELKSLVVNGEFPGIPSEHNYLEATVYTIEFIEQVSIEKLYTFTVSSGVLSELSYIAKNYCSRFMNGNFKSLSVLEGLLI